MELREITASLASLSEQLEQVFIGQHAVTESLIMGLLCNGNVLLEGFPGTAKTRAVKTLASLVEGTLGRVQFTPDLLPSDITGTEVFHQEEHRDTLVFQPGPIFNNLVLADEINRAPAKVQSALLEAMEERQVTVAGKCYKLPRLFMVLATQNPIEQEGTYPLPEAQMDRFLLKVKIDYPDTETELGILRLVRSEEETEAPQLRPVSQNVIFAARKAIKQVYVAEPVERYMVALTMATRNQSGDGGDRIAMGASPRATIALDRCSRCHALLRGRDYVEPGDVRSVIHPVFRHRIALSYRAMAEGLEVDSVIGDIVSSVVPV